MPFLKLAPEVQSNSVGDDFIFVLSFPKSRTSLLGIDSQPTWHFACALSYRFDVMFLMITKSSLVKSKFTTKFPSFMISTWFTKIAFFSLSIVSRSPPVRQHTSFFPNLPHAVDWTLSVFSGLVCERKVSHLKERKKGSYVRFIDALAELRAIKIACSFLQKIMSAQKLQSLFIALRWSTSATVMNMS